MPPEPRETAPLSAKGGAFLRETRQLLLVTLACLVYSAAWTALILPYGIVSGGVAGLSNLVYYVTKLPVAATYAGVNALLFLLAFKLLGWKFFAKTIYATAAISIFLCLGQRILTDPATGGLVKILEEERFMAMLIGCCISGLSVAALFACSGSSGGTDIIAAIANKYLDVPVGMSMIAMDLVIIGSGLFIPELGTTLERVRFVAFGFCAMGVECATISYALNLRRRSVQFLIFTNRHAELSKAIAEATGHSMTLLDGHGFFTGGEKKVICVLARMNESATIFRIIKSVDPGAFVSQSQVIGVYGEGFDKMKARVRGS